MATHAGVALELGITRPAGGGMKTMSPQMEAILIWCQCRVREYEVRMGRRLIVNKCVRFCCYELFQGVKIENFTSSWADGVSFCALIHHFFPQAFDFRKVDRNNRRANYELAFSTGE